MAVAGPALVLAGVGLTHPTELTPDTAPWWTTMHTLLLVVFPLLGLSLGLLLRGVPGPLAWVARIAAFGYAAFYTGLDVLAGIGTGGLVQRGSSPDSEEVWGLFALGNDLGDIGVWCFLVACAATAAALVARLGGRALPGAALLVASAVPFMGSHIYWPAGVAAMLGLALGFALLAAAGDRPPTSAAPEPDPHPEEVAADIPPLT